MLATIYIFLFFELLFVGWIDLRFKRISNWWALMNIMIFISLMFMYPQIYGFHFATFFYALAFLIVGFTLFMVKIMGAGDVKYLFTFYLLVPSRYHDSAFLALLYVTVSVGIVLLAYNTLKNFNRIWYALVFRDVQMIKTIFGKKFSFAPIILASWIWFGWEKRKEIFPW